MTDPSDASPDAPDRSWLPWLLTGVLAVVLVALVVTTTLVWKDTQPREDDDGAVGVAEQAVRDFHGLDYRDPEAGIERILDVATGDFKKEFERDRPDLEKNLVKKKLTLTADIPDNGAALEYLSEEKAQVLIAVDVTTTAASGLSSKRLLRARVVLDWVDDEWLVSELHYVGGVE